MKRFMLFSVLALSFGYAVRAQNLVTNPGFELYGACLNYSSWTNCLNTPDQFNTCNGTVPANFAGNQATYGGNGYIALVDRHASANYHEFYCVPLTSALVIGTPYYCEMQVSLTELSTIGADNMGFQFNTVAAASVNNISQVYTSSIITNKTNWVQVSGIFTPTTAFSFVAVGNFFADVLTATATAVGGTYTGAYYYIDGVIVTPNIPLPIELLKFDASARSNFIDVAWTTASEHNTALFSVERSADGQLFEHVGNIEAAGNSNKLLQYEFTDSLPLKAISYYRLRQTDNDGKHSFTKLVSVEFKAKTAITIYPNPSNGVVMFVGEFSIPATLEVYDIAGRLVFQKQIDSNPTSCDLSQLDNGVYFWQAANKNGRIIKN